MQATAMPPAQVAEAAAAAVGCARIPTNVSMSLIDLILLDHNTVRAMYDAFRSPTVSLKHKQLLSWSMIMALSSHAAKEEMIVYPVLRSTLGPAVADQLTGEHSAVKSMLATLDTMDATDPGFDMQLRTTMDQMIAHMQEEETNVLPQLAALVSADSLLQLGIQFEASKVRAPTRPHPEAASQAPFNEITFAAAKQVDVALDQARMPTLVPDQVLLSPLVSSAINAAAAAAVAPVPSVAGAAVANAPGDLPAAGFTGFAGGNDGSSLVPPSPAPDAFAEDGLLLTPAPDAGAGMTGAGFAGAAGFMEGVTGADTDMGLGPAGGEIPGGDAGDVAMEALPGEQGEQGEGLMEDAAGAAGGMPGDLTGTAGGEFSSGDAGGGEERQLKAAKLDLAPGGAPEELPEVQ